MFNETRLLDKVAYGSEFGQEFNTRIVQLRSGVERRNINWSAPLGRGAVRYSMLKSSEDHDLVRSAHMASFGSAIGFRFKDWTDYQADNESLGVATGLSQTLPLYKRYQFGPLELERRIKKPVQGTVQVFADGIEVVSTLDSVDGEVSFTATAGAVMTWSGEFDIPVRFESDRLDVTPVAKIGGGFALTCDVGIIEVRL